MSEGTSNSVVSLGDIAKPADTLIKKVAKAIGGIFEPYQITRVAKAEAEASIIKAQAEIQVTDIQRRAMHRFIEEQANYQQNMEAITQKALPHLQENSNPDSMDDDWVTNFFDKSRIVSDGEMQDLWSRVLAGEANSPGTYSKRTVNFLSDLDKTDAELFSKLCGFGWIIGDVVPLVFDHEAEIYRASGINFSALSHLESIGLIHFASLAGFVKSVIGKRGAVHYYGEPFYLNFPNDSKNRLDIGKVMLTKIGQELAPICGSKPVKGFRDYVCKAWKAFLPQESSNKDEFTDAANT
jgi:hypothetical protein